MAQSSDSNNSNRVDEFGKDDAVQILDSIIGHIESTDEPNSDRGSHQKRNLDESVDPEHPSQHHDKTEDHANAGLSLIEKRAAELASKLGGSGLSFGNNTKLHLQDLPEPTGFGDRSSNLENEVSVHADDLDMDTHLFDSSSKKGGATAEIDQQHHVKEWQQDVKKERREKEQSVGDTVELKGIEQQIEALTVSMQSSENLQEELREKGVQQRNTDEPEVISHALEDVNTRISSLESQVVQLLDKVAVSDRKLSDTVTSVMRSETQKAVKEAIASSNLIGSMRSELDNVGKERDLQEAHLSDSLDALHDSLKDMGERLCAVEQAGETLQSASNDVMSIGEGIASSVLGTQRRSSDAELQLPILDGEPEQEGVASLQSVEPVDDDLPTWLEDTTQNLQEDEDVESEQPADVFAMNAKEEGVKTELKPSAELDTNTEVFGNRPVEQAREELSFEQNGAATSVINQGTNEPQIMQERQELSVVTDNTIEPRQTQSLRQQASAGGDFLLAARAAARAANGRAHTTTENIAPNAGNEDDSHQNSSLIAAAKQKQQEASMASAAPQAKSSHRNSLFSDKVEGPNSLLIFTSLILFGTSALLLYGMSKNGNEAGSVATLNAVEKEVVTPQISSSGSSVVQAVKNRKIKPVRFPGKNKPKIKNSSDKSSWFDALGKESERSEFKLATVEQGKADAGGDTLTDFDKMVKNRLAMGTPVPSMVEFTGALPDRTEKEKAGSLFDEYVTFSNMTDPLGNKKKPSNDEQSGTVALQKRSISRALLSSANKGDARAQYEIARRFGKGINVAKSPVVSVEWYEKSANAGYAPAIYRLATMYERGNGVTKNYNKAMQLYIKAASKGNVKAMHNLAVLYTGGYLGKADYKRAIKWYEKAAQYGVKDSQFNLAIIYQNGMGGKRDLVKAYKWYTLAGRAGDLEARDMAADLREDLSLAKRRKLESRLLKWKAKIPNSSSNAAPQYSEEKADARVTDNVIR